MYKQYTKDIDIPQTQYTSTIPEYEISKTELETLPSNWEEILQENNITLSNKQITQLLLDGYIQLGEGIEISKDTPILLTTENVKGYVESEISDIEQGIKEKIEDEITKEINKIKIQALLIYPYVTEEEKQTIQNISLGKTTIENTEEILRLTNRKERNISLLEIYRSIEEGEDVDTNIEEIPNTLHIEDNDPYYTQLISYIQNKKDILEELDIYTNEYEALLLALQSLLEGDTEVYRQIYNPNLPYTILSTLEDGTLAISKTDTVIGNTEILDTNFNSEYDVTPVIQSTYPVRIPVLMYHQIGTAPAGSSSFVQGLYISPEMFEKQIAYLTKKNYKTLNSEEFYNILKSGKNPEQKSIMISFDDGKISHYTQAYPILKKYGQKGVFFITSGSSAITPSQLKEMSDMGMDIQSHTMTHKDLTKISGTELQSEIGGSKYVIQSSTGRGVISIAYPGCVANTAAQQVVANSGYILGFSCGKSIDHTYFSRLSLSRVHNPHNIEDLKKILSGIYPF